MQTGRNDLEGREFIPDTSSPDNTWMERYISPDDRAHMWNAIQEALQTKQIFDLTHRVLRVDGRSGWMHSRAIPIEYENGKIIEWFGTAINTDQQRKDNTKHDT